jgi:predicted amidophosphoribosyltransferase
MFTHTQTERGEPMAKIIKLENIQKGEATDLKEKVTEEYVCSACRHLVKSTDTVCWQCGANLEQSSTVEHYHRGKELTDDRFSKLSEKLKKKGGKL